MRNLRPGTMLGLRFFGGIGNIGAKGAKFAVRKHVGFTGFCVVIALFVEYYVFRG